MKTYTDEQLKRVLAKLAPDKLKIGKDDGSLIWLHDSNDHCEGNDVNPESLLQIVRDIEVTLSDGKNSCSNWIRYVEALKSSFGNTRLLYPEATYIHASWQHKTIALAKFFGIEIV